MLKLITLLAAAFFASAARVVDHENQVLQPDSQRARRSQAPLALFFKSLPKFCQ